MAQPTPLDTPSRRRRWVVRMAVCTLAGMTLAAAIVPQIVDPFAIDFRTLSPTAPSFQHWFGTDEVGRDLGARIALGLRLSLGTALGVALTWGIPCLLIGFAVSRFHKSRTSRPALLMTTSVALMLCLTLGAVWWIFAPVAHTPYVWPLFPSMFWVLAAGLAAAVWALHTRIPYNDRKTLVRRACAWLLLIGIAGACAEPRLSWMGMTRYQPPHTSLGQLVLVIDSSSGQWWTRFLPVAFWALLMIAACVLIWALAQPRPGHERSTVDTIPRT